MDKTYKFSIEIPAYIAAKLQSLGSRYGCSPKAVMLAGIIDAVEAGSKSLSNYEMQDEFKFKLALIEGAYRPKNNRRKGGK